MFVCFTRRHAFKISVLTLTYIHILLRHEASKRRVFFYLCFFLYFLIFSFLWLVCCNAYFSGRYLLLYLYIIRLDEVRRSKAFCLLVSYLCACPIVFTLFPLIIYYLIVFSFPILFTIFFGLLLQKFSNFLQAIKFLTFLASSYEEASFFEFIKRRR